MTTKEKIVELFESQQELSVKEIVQRLDVSNQMVHIAVKKLLEEGKVEKFGRTPSTFYRIKSTSKTVGVLHSVSEETNTWLNKEFLLVTENGEIKYGIEAFEIWCRQRKLPLEKTLEEFRLTKERYKVYYNKEGIIDGMEKLVNTKGYESISLDKLFYIDFYAIERFGKTPLGTLIHYAKQGQNKYLMKMMVQQIKDKIHAVLDKYKADAVCFVPPTIRREVQIMKYLQQHLHINLPTVTIKKISGLIPVPQKSLNKLEERISNAQKTFLISETRKFKKIALIDDAVGSGATMNEIAKKIKDKKIADEIVGIAVTGSFKGFDVITDV
jgi:DNA-binding Lrp family transcriptional regulator